MLRIKLHNGTTVILRDDHTALGYQLSIISADGPVIMPSHQKLDKIARQIANDRYVNWNLDQVEPHPHSYRQVLSPRVHLQEVVRAFQEAIEVTQ